MGDQVRLSGDDWEALLRLPFAAYSAASQAGEAAGAAQFRRFHEELDAGRAAFAEGTTGASLTDALAANPDTLWSAYHAEGKSPEDAAKRGMKVLRKVPEAESIAIRDWLLLVALRVAAAYRVVGEEPVSRDEAYAIRDLAKWLDRPLPEFDQA